MSTRSVTMIEVVCDSCGTTAELYDEGATRLFDTDAEVLAFLEAERTHGGGWTEDGHGAHRCERCVPLVLDPAVDEQRQAEKARQLTDADVPLFGLEG